MKVTFVILKKIHFKVQLSEFYFPPIYTDAVWQGSEELHSMMSVLGKYIEC